MKNLEIRGKNFLVFYPDFFGYGEMIKNKIEELGGCVTLHNSRAVKTALGKAFFKICPEVVINLSKPYFDSILESKRKENIDYVIVVERLPIGFLKELRRQHSSAKFVLYMDDSIKNLKGIEKRFQLFDSVFSFDNADVKLYPNIIFRPLFYSDECKKAGEINKKINYEYDLCFIGTCHSDRYYVAKQIARQCQEKGYRFYLYLYLQSKFMYWYYKFTDKRYRKSKKEDFEYQKEKYENLVEIEKKSKVILDIQHNRQTGLTMRTIEMLGMSKKIITTNQFIQRYDFYNPTNILIIDRNNPVISDKFFEADYEAVPAEIYNKYSLESWIYEILGLGDECDR